MAMAPRPYHPFRMTSARTTLIAPPVLNVERHCQVNSGAALPLPYNRTIRTGNAGSRSKVGASGKQVHPLLRLLGRRPSPSAEDSPELGALRQQLAVVQAVEQERKRIYNDLHDDVGSALLTLLHRVPDSEQQLVREILQDLRAILAHERGVEGTLLEVLAQLRDEVEQRLLTRSIGLDWHQADNLPDPLLDRAQGMHLFRIGREAVTNAIRHANPTRVRIVVRQLDTDLIFEITDDGRFDPDRIGGGRGTRSMRSRADELHGDIHWQQGTLGGTKVLLRFPLPTPPATAGFPMAAPDGSITP